MGWRQCGMGMGGGWELSSALKSTENALSGVENLFIYYAYLCKCFKWANRDRVKWRRVKSFRLKWYGRGENNHYNYRAIYKYIEMVTVKFGFPHFWFWICDCEDLLPCKLYCWINLFILNSLQLFGIGVCNIICYFWLFIDIQKNKEIIYLWWGWGVVVKRNLWIYSQNCHSTLMKCVNGEWRVVVDESVLCE